MTTANTTTKAATKPLTPAQIAKLSWDKGLTRIDTLSEMKKERLTAKKEKGLSKDEKKEIQAQVNALDCERFAIVDHLKESGDKVGGWALGRTGKRHSIVIRYKAKA